MINQILNSALELFRRFELAMDYDPIEAQARRLALLELRFEEASKRSRPGMAIHERSTDGVEASIAAE
jgi:hypothetical protein